MGEGGKARELMFGATSPQRRKQSLSAIRKKSSLVKGEAIRSSTFQKRETVSDMLGLAPYSPTTQ